MYLTPGIHAGRATGWRPGLFRRANRVKDYERPGWPLMGTHANNLE